MIAEQIQTAEQIAMAHALIPYLITVLCGALILLLLAIWLRLRNVKKSSPVWLCLCLLSWALAISLEVFELNWLSKIIKPDHVKYLVSPVSSFCFAWTAFQLSRVRDRLTDKEYRLSRAIVMIIITIGSLVSVGLLFKEHFRSGRYLDASISSIASLVFAFGLSYSFYKYGNRFLFWLTWITLLFFIFRQFYLAGHRTPIEGIYAHLFFANSALLVMLFIALGVAWALSETARLKPVGVLANVPVVSMFLDLRGSTKWANEIEGDFDYVIDFLDDLREWIESRCSKLSEGRPKLIKSLGDGFLLVWEVPKHSIPESSKAIIQLACSLSTDYSSWVKDEKFTERHVWGTPAAIGIGVDVGKATRLIYENGSDDYLGTPINYSAKMQNLARPHGVVIQKKVWMILNDNLRNRFPEEGTMRLGNLVIPIQITKDVEL